MKYALGNSNSNWIFCQSLASHDPRSSDTSSSLGSMRNKPTRSPPRRRLLQSAMAAAVCTHLCSCTSVDFYESKNSKAYQTNKDEKGFLYYPPKPYLLVEQTKESEKFSILSIPDVSRPHRVKQIPGIGTGELGFEINSGMIVKFNSKTDSKTPEIISALTSIGTAKAALVAAKVATETATKTLEQDPANVTKITTQPFTFIVVPIQESIKELRAALVALRRPAQGTEIFRTLIERIENQIKELESRRTITYPINKPDELLKKVDDARKIGCRK